MQKTKLKILIVAIPDSIHTVRWINQITDLGWEIHLFPSVDCNELRIDKDFRHIVTHLLFYGHRRKNIHPSQKIYGIPVFSNFLSDIIRWFIRTKISSKYRVWHLNYLIRKIKPDIIHSIEFQHAGYFVAEAKKNYKGRFPAWIATNWGSDIYFYGRLREHLPKIKEVLSSCDYYSCECRRDVCLAQNTGLKGKVLPVFPNTGGFNLLAVKKWRSKNETSKRKIILLKGYQGIFGRALAGLRALERCAEILKGYKIVIFSNYKDSDMDFALKIFSKKTSIQTQLVPWTTHQEILKLQGRARIYIGLSISDAISTSLLESMVMGSFPIQSNTACADEWIEDGKTGILVPPEDPDIIEKAIRKALMDDKLVNEASRINWQIARQKLSMEKLQKQTIDFYRQVSRETGGDN